MGILLTWFVLALKKIDLASAAAVHLTKLTGKSEVPVHPKHFLTQTPWFTKYIKKNDRILDLGCGNGQNTKKAAKIAKKVVGIDLDENSLALAKKSIRLKNITFKKVGLEKPLPFKDASFNKVLFLDVLEHLEKRDQALDEAKRVLVPGGRFAVNIAPTGIKDFVPIHHDFITQLRRLGMKFRTEILWYKQTMLKRTAWGSFRSPANPHIVPSWEYVLVFSKEKDRLDGVQRNSDITKEEFMNFSDGFWKISPETKRNGHPAPFPEELIYRLIKFYSYRDNTVLDMFGGTGTVAVVAHKTNRHFIHIDISEEYNNVALKRLANEKKSSVGTF